MLSLGRGLAHCSPALLRAIAEVNGITLTNNQPQHMAAHLAGWLAEPEHLAATVAACSPAAQAALAALLREGGSPRAAFERTYGAVRPVGPARLERERWHLSPASPVEELWYRGLIFPAMIETPEGLAEFLQAPDEVAALLPAPSSSPRPYPPEPAAAPAAAHAEVDWLLHDMVALLHTVQAGLATLVKPGDWLAWSSRALDEYGRLALQSWAGLEASQPVDLHHQPGATPVLAAALAAEMGWLRTERGRRLALNPAPVREWLDAPRAVQRRALWQAWAQSSEWNDLCRTPALSCEQTGSWANDPLRTRERVLDLLAQLDPTAWYGVDAWCAAIRRAEPDFQRVDGNYTTWYVRRRGAPEFLRGFEQWDAVEGELLRSLLGGPLCWLAAVRISQPPDAAARFQLTPSGDAALHSAAPPPEPEQGALAVERDFTVLVPHDAAVRDRFRAARVAAFVETRGLPNGQPLFVYRITQTSLRAAAQQHISAAQVLDFLQARANAALPDNVARALTRWT